MILFFDNALKNLGKFILFDEIEYIYPFFNLL